jgi:hypothetical protein
MGLVYPLSLNALYLFLRDADSAAKAKNAKLLIIVEVPDASLRYFPAASYLLDGIAV